MLLKAGRKQASTSDAAFMRSVHVKILVYPPLDIHEAHFGMAVRRLCKQY